MRLIWTFMTVAAVAFAIQWATRCPHRTTYRERRKYKGVPNVMHFVCEKCGYAAPAMSRTVQEHRRTVKRGALAVPEAHRPRTTVIEMRKGTSR